MAGVLLRIMKLEWKVCRFLNNRDFVCTVSFYRFLKGKHFSLDEEEIRGEEEYNFEACWERMVDLIRFVGKKR